MYKHEMDFFHLFPTEVTYTNLISACVKRRDHYEEAFSLVAEMRAAGFEPPTQTLNVLLYGAGLNGDLTRAKGIFTILSERGQLDSYSYTGLISAYAFAGKWYPKKVRKNVFLFICFFPEFPIKMISFRWKNL
jgi:pentatricopeptide repeat protein